MAPLGALLFSRRFENCTFTEDGYIDESSCDVPFWVSRVGVVPCRLRTTKRKTDAAVDWCYRQMVTLPWRSGDTRPLPPDRLYTRSEAYTEGSTTPEIPPSMFSRELIVDTNSNPCPSSWSPAQHSPHLTLATGLPRPQTSLRIPPTPNITTCTQCLPRYTTPTPLARPCTSLLRAQPKPIPISSTMPGRVSSRQRNMSSIGHRLVHPQLLPVSYETHTHHLPAPLRAQSGPRVLATPILSGTEKGGCIGRS